MSKFVARNGRNSIAQGEAQRNPGYANVNGIAALKGQPAAKLAM